MNTLNSFSMRILSALECYCLILYNTMSQCFAISTLKAHFFTGNVLTTYNRMQRYNRYYKQIFSVISVPFP